MFKYTFTESIDSPERTIKHRDIILKKNFLKKIYLSWYASLSNKITNVPAGKILEIGSGGGFLKQVIPSVISSDILDLPHNDLTFSALNMPFEDNSISAILLVDTFHHIPDSEQFLNEVNRVLVNQGKLVMSEPANTFFGRFIYKNFHHEPFNPYGDWKIPSSGPMSDANGALPWIVFIRDKNVFNEKYKNLKIEEIHFHTAFLYLISGGVSFKSFMPGFLFKPLLILDNFIVKIFPWTAMFQTICVKKQI